MTKTKRGNTGDNFGKVMNQPEEENKGDNPLAATVLASYYKMFGKPSNVNDGMSRAVNIGGHRWRVTCWSRVAEFTLMPTPTACVRCDDEGNVLEVLPDRKVGAFHKGTISDPNKRGGRWN